MPKPRPLRDARRAGLPVEALAPARGGPLPTAGRGPCSPCRGAGAARGGRRGARGPCSGAQGPGPSVELRVSWPPRPARAEGLSVAWPSVQPVLVHEDRVPLAPAFDELLVTLVGSSLPRAWHGRTWALQWNGGPPPASLPRPASLELVPVLPLGLVEVRAVTQGRPPRVPPRGGGSKRPPTPPAAGAGVRKKNGRVSTKK